MAAMDFGVFRLNFTTMNIAGVFEIADYDFDVKSGKFKMAISM